MPRLAGLRLVPELGPRLGLRLTFGLKLAGARLVLLLLLRGLVHGVQDAKVVLGVLEVAFGHHPVAGAGRVPAELEILLE